MKRWWLRFIAAILCLPAISASPQWKGKMQDLGKTFSELLPDLVSSQPLSPKAKANLEQQTRKLLKLAHGVRMDASSPNRSLPPDADPTLALVSNLFERDVRSASQALQVGNVDYAKRKLRAVSSYCITCHTRNNEGAHFPSLTLSPRSERLSEIEKARLWTATRQFDRALEAFEKIATDQKVASEHPFEWGAAMREAFTIAIRVKNDPDRPLALVSKVLAMPEQPLLFKEMIPVWKKSLEAWKAETPKELKTEDEWFAEASRLYDNARASQQYWHDRSGDVLFLRFSYAVHQLLAKYPDGKHAGEALMMAGIAYELLDDWLISPLPDRYFEACIRRVPHTETAHRCYARLEESAYIGYTGTAGTHIPPDVKTILRELAKLAEPR